MHVREGKRREGRAEGEGGKRGGGGREEGMGGGVEGRGEGEEGKRGGEGGRGEGEGGKRGGGGRPIIHYRASQTTHTNLSTPCIHFTPPVSLFHST